MPALGFQLLDRTLQFIHFTAMHWQAELINTDEAGHLTLPPDTARSDSLNLISCDSMGKV